MDPKKEKSSVRAFAPASVANVSCGFDVLAFAINGPGDIVEVSRRTEPGVVIESISGDDGLLPKSPPIENTAGRAVIAMLNELGLEETTGISISIEKMMPLGSGMGSSAASSVAAVVALNHLLNEPYQTEDLLQFALEGELARITAGIERLAGERLLVVLRRGRARPRGRPDLHRQHL